MSVGFNSQQSLWEALIGNGLGLLKLTGIGLIGSGLFAFFLAATGHFLPHDLEFLGATADSLYSIADNRLAHFMIHDRVSFGGAIFGVGVLYLWLAEFPLRAGAVWAWWTFLLSGTLGFMSFLTYLGYGYLDTWHGVATLVLLPVFCLGMYRSIKLLPPEQSIDAIFKPGLQGEWKSRYGVGRIFLLSTSASLIAGGLIIMTVGMTVVFVPEDLEFMNLCTADLDAVNPRLIPLIAHDRAGFGGGVCCCGLTMYLCVYCSGPSRSLWQALALTGLAGFGTAIGVHYPIGYTAFTHLAPAYLGAIMFVIGMVMTYDKQVWSVTKETT